VFKPVANADRGDTSLGEDLAEAGVAVIAEHRDCPARWAMPAAISGYWTGRF
jgi:hypothetical protein